jgi:hypothetical protein
MDPIFLSLNSDKFPSVPQKAQKYVDPDTMITMMMSLPCENKAVDGDLQVDT